MKDVSNAQRPVIGSLANHVRSGVEAAINQKMEEFRQKRLEERIKNETVDITLPARHTKIGHLHPLDKALREITQSFIRMGYSVEEGPEIEQDYYNFECLNLPKIIRQEICRILSISLRKFFFVHIHLLFRQEH